MIVRTRLHRSVFTGLVAGLIPLAAVPQALRADDNRAFLPKGETVVVELPRGADILQHPVVAGLLAGVQKSSQWEAIQSSPQFDRLRLIGELIAKATGDDWKTGLRKLTAGGAALSFSPAKTAGLTAVLTAADETALKRFITISKQHVQSRLPEPQRKHVYRTVRRDGHEITRVGPAAFAVVGKRLIVASTERRLLDALKRGANSAKSSRKPTALARVSVDVAAIRKTPDFAKALKHPAKDAGGVAILGGWVDLLRTADHVTAEVVPDGKSLEIRLRSNAARHKTTPGLEGFFTDGKREKVAPLLQLPNTIYSASWYRDYRALWRSRAKLLTAQSRKTIEEGDETVRQQLSVIGAKTLPSRAFSLLGTRYRVVVTRQQKTEYRVDLPSKLPLAGLAVELRDESAFRKEVIPFFRGLSLILSFEQKMVLTKSKHKGADLVGLRFRDDETAASEGNRIRFNFAPTYAVTRKHLLVGTTPAIVRQMIDEIDRQARQHSVVTTTATELQSLSLTESAQAIRDFGSTLTLALSFNGGLSVAESKRELELLAKFLESVGKITTEAGFDAKGFQYRIRIGNKK